MILGRAAVGGVSEAGVEEGKAVVAVPWIRAVLAPLLSAMS